MYVPPLRPPSHDDTYISGEVTIDPSAAIAPGVLLQASPNSKIIIGAGVCIGMGSILHAYEGVLEIEVGANLGSGVLILGKGKIGANACVGSTATILSSSIEPQQVVLPGSLIGDKSRIVVAHSTVAGIDTINETASGSPKQTNNGDSSPAMNNSPPTPTSPEPSSESSESPPLEQPTPQVYGQAQLNRMLSTMFPYRQALNRPLQDGQSPSDQP
jgi:carbon dioxide concentrating mechanism protein CcmN